jgi:hypothetical protein
MAGDERIAPKRATAPDGTATMLIVAGCSSGVPAIRNEPPSGSSTPSCHEASRTARAALGVHELGDERDLGVEGLARRRASERKNGVPVRPAVSDADRAQEVGTTAGRAPGAAILGTAAIARRS